MNVLMVRAKVKAESAADVEAAIERVLSAIEQAQPAGVRYASSRLAAPSELTDVAAPQGHGLAWLLAAAQRADAINQHVANVGDASRQGRCRSVFVTEHAHRAVEDPRFDHCRVAVGLHLKLCPTTAHSHSGNFAIEVALFRVAYSLLDRLTRN
jgi:hypothetical protein